MKLTRENLIGPWAGLPVAWNESNEFDEETYRGDVVRSCKAGVPGIYTAGTTGEFYAQEFDEFKAITRATVEECCAHQVPSMIGVTSTHTLGAARRAAVARELGADSIQVALPFWMEVPDRSVVPFFREVSRASGDLPLSVYETMRTKKALTLDQHRQIKDALPNYLMVKSNANTIGTTADGCAALSKFVNVFVNENLWGALGPHGAVGCCSALVYANPRVILQIWSLLRTQQWDALRKQSALLGRLDEYLESAIGPKGYTDTSYDRLATVATGFLKTSLHSRGPYPSAAKEDLELFRSWCRTNFPELLVL